MEKKIGPLKAADGELLSSVEKISKIMKECNLSESGGKHDTLFVSG